jgi:hypothetical protein
MLTENPATGVLDVSRVYIWMVKWVLSSFDVDSSSVRQYAQHKCR